MSVVWKNRDSPPPKQVKVVKLIGKVICAVFMDSLVFSVILVHMVPAGHTVKEAFAWKNDFKIARRPDTLFELKYCVVQKSV